jgi:hypothetical protein
VIAFKNKWKKKMRERRKGRRVGKEKQCSVNLPFEHDDLGYQFSGDPTKHRGL